MLTASFQLLENTPWLIMMVLELLLPIQDKKYRCVNKTEKKPRVHVQNDPYRGL